MRRRALLQDIEHTPIARVGHIGPGVDVAGVEVLEDARHVVLVVLEPRRGVEPDLILGNRAAERRVDVKRLLQRIRRRQAASWVCCLPEPELAPVANIDALKALPPSFGM